MELNNWKAQMKKGALEMVILALLKNDQKYGLEIITLLKDAHGLDIAEGTIYPIFSRLKSEGLIRSNWVYADTGHPRKYYSLTVKGREQLGRMTKEWDDFAGWIDKVICPAVPVASPVKSKKVKYGT